MSEKTVVKVQRTDLLDLFKELKINSVTEEWPNGRLIARAKKVFPGLETVPEISKDAHKTFEQLLEAIKNEDEIEVDGEATVKTKPSRNGNGNGKASKNAKSDKEKADRDKFGSLVGSNRSKLNAAISKKPKTMSELVEQSGIPRPYYRHMRELVEKKLVEQDNEGKFCLASKSE